MKRHLALASLVLALLACGGGGDKKTSSSSLTVRAVCEDVVDAICTRYGECSGPTPPGSTSCTNEFMPICCSGDECSRTISVAQSDVDHCVDAILASSCGAVLDAEIPSECDGV